MPDPKRPLKVFLCHAHADRDAVRGLYTRLTKDGVDAWLDKEKLLPGQDWELEIRKAVRESDVVVVCLSKQFNQAGFRQKEVRLALDTAMEKPEGEIFIIPARLEECDALESLRKWHWVDLFEDDGYEMLLRAFRARADRIGATLQIKRSWLPTVITQPTSENKPSKPVKNKPSGQGIPNYLIGGRVLLIVLVIALIFGLSSLIGNPASTPIATNTEIFNTFTAIPASKTPTYTFTLLLPTEIPSFTPTMMITPTSTFIPTSTITPIIGEWLLNYDWQCDGNPSQATLKFSDGDTFELIDYGTTYIGHWKLDGKNIEWVNTNAPTLIYTGKVTGDTMDGTMPDGCWNAQRK